MRRHRPSASSSWPSCWSPSSARATPPSRPPITVAGRRSPPRSSTRRTSARPIRASWSPPTTRTSPATRWPSQARHLARRQAGDGGDSTGFVSDGVRTQLREIVVADPSIIGTTRDVCAARQPPISIGAYKGQIDLNVARGASARSPTSRSPGSTSQMQPTGAISTAVQLRACSPSAPPAVPRPPGMGVALIGSLYMMVIVLLLRAAHRRRRLDLPGGVRQEEPLHRLHRGEHQQPRRGAVDRLRPASAWRCSSTSSACRARPHRRRPGADADDPAHHHHRHPRGACRRAAVDPRRPALGLGASKIAGGVPARAAARHARASSPAPIIGLARALGETAPLLLIGMVAFVADYPTTPLDPATALPVQILRGPTRPNAFVERMSGAIIILSGVPHGR